MTLLNNESKSATFQSTVVDTTRDSIIGFAVTTASQSSLNVSIQLEASWDESNWISVGSPTAVTTNTTSSFTQVDNPYPFLRLNATFTAGSANFTIHCHTKSFG
jgi:hypothetical protein